MFDNCYLVNWKLYNKARKITGEFVDAMTATITNIDFIDDTDNLKLLSFIKTSDNKSFIFPLYNSISGLPQKQQVSYRHFMENIVIKLLNTDLKNNTIYIPSPGDSMYTASKNKYQRQHNRLVNLLWRNPNDNIKIIIPLRNFENIRLSSQVKCGFHPLLTNYNHILLFPHQLYCYKLAKMDLNVNPINKILLSGAVSSSAYPDRFKFKKLVKKFPKYLAYYEKKSDERKKQKYSDANEYNITLNKYIAAFYSGVHKTDDQVLLQKFYEILGSGALLLLEKKSKINCDILGLVENEHYLTIDLQTNEKTIMNKIKFILNDTNKEYILNIRDNGRRFCHEHLDYRYSTDKFLNLLKTNLT